MKAQTLSLLKPTSIDAISQRFCSFFKQNHVKLFGFYSNVEGYINNAVRDDHHDITETKFEELKKTRELEYDKWLASEIQNWKGGVGKTVLLEKLFQNFCGFLAQFHADNLRQSYEVVYDSRNDLEDKEVMQRGTSITELIVKHLQTQKNIPSSFFKGIEASNSSDTVGLRLADFVAGSFRALFRAYPNLLTDNADFEVLSAKRNSQMITRNGETVPFYERAMDQNLADAIRRKGQGLAFPHWQEFFAKRVFSYITAGGAARHCLLDHMTYTDMAD